MFVQGLECDEDCELGSWNPWGSCSSSCGVDSYRTRNRKLVSATNLGRTRASANLVNNILVIMTYQFWLSVGQHISGRDWLGRVGLRVGAAISAWLGWVLG